MNRFVPPFRAAALAAAATAILASHASAQLLVTYAESPDALTSSLSNTTVYDFDSLSPGEHDGVSWTGVGTFDHLYILAPDQYGGASDAANDYGSNYSVQSQVVGGGLVPVTTITLDSAHAYFGFWWSAGDATNVISFYKGDTLVAQYNTSTLLDALASEPAYKGNPKNRNEDSNESFAFINCLGMNGTTWDKIVLTNNGTSGFESDNYTDRAAPYNPTTDGPIPGVQVATVDGTTITPVVPEASSVALLSVAGLAAALRRRRA